MDIVHDAVAPCVLISWQVGLRMRSLWTGQVWVVGLGPRRIISTKKVAVIVQNYHCEPCYFDDDAIV